MRTEVGIAVTSAPADLHNATQMIGMCRIQQSRATRPLTQAACGSTVIHGVLGAWGRPGNRAVVVRLGRARIVSPARMHGSAALSAVDLAALGTGDRA